MNDKEIEKFFCNLCKQKTKHYICGSHNKVEQDDHEIVSLHHRYLIVECCGCEHTSLVKMTHFSEDIEHSYHPHTGETVSEAIWEEAIYPPVAYRSAPLWFEDLPDDTLREIAAEIYKSLQSESYFLATFGSRTLIDRLIVLTVGDRGNFQKGLQSLQDEGKLSQHEREILNPIVDAGNAAAHRGWSPTKEQITIILDTVEGLIHRLLVLPKLAEELEEAVPSRRGNAKTTTLKSTLTVEDKVKVAPKELRATYDYLIEKLKSQGGDVTMHPQKHYIAFRRNRNFASVQIYNQKRVVRVYLNIDPDNVDVTSSLIRDVRQIGHFGTGDLEVTIKTKKDIDEIADLLEMSYTLS